MLYINQGKIQGTLVVDPQTLAPGIVTLTVRVRDERVNPKTNRRDFHFPNFVVFGKEAEKAVKNLVKGQEVAIDYKLETRKKEIKGETRFFEDKVATRILYGQRPDIEVVPMQKDTPKEKVKEEPKEESAEEVPVEDN